MQLIIEYKGGYYENYDIKKFFIESSKIRIETKDKILYFDYAEIKNIEIID